MSSPLIAANWKQNFRQADVETWIAAFKDHCPVSAMEGVDVLVCPPMAYAASLVQQCADAKVLVGGQTVSEHIQDGTHTGEVSAAMLVDIGCSHVLIGHSERRLAGESHAQVAAQLAAALSEPELTPILCVGESLPEREAGHSLEVVTNQITNAIQGLRLDSLSNLVIAYEPVWAISSGAGSQSPSATPQDIEDMLSKIRAHLHSLDATIAGSIRLLYGGSIKPSNAKAIFALPSVDGGLVGGAALQAESFAEVVKAAC